MLRSVKLGLLAVAVLAGGYIVAAEPIRTPYDLLGEAESTTKGVTDAANAGRKARSGIFDDFLTWFDYDDTSDTYDKHGDDDDSYGWGDLFDYFDESQEAYLVCRNCTVVLHQQNQTSSEPAPSSPGITQPEAVTSEMTAPTTASTNATQTPPGTETTANAAPSSTTAAQTPPSDAGDKTTATTAAGSSPQASVSPASTGAPTDTTAGTSSSQTSASPASSDSPTSTSADPKASPATDDKASTAAAPKK